MTAPIANAPVNGNHSEVSIESNPLRAYFENHKSGPGIWKWRHYFDIYHRHFQKFVGRKPNVLEIGIYSGGSLDMWRSYFGNDTQIIGVDIEDACRAYEREGIKVVIGDQQDRSFWATFRQHTPMMDIVIDDGGHTTEQQITTLEETLPHLKPGGVFLCEDVHGYLNDFASYATGLVHRLNSDQGSVAGESFVRTASEFQRSVASIHFYPQVVVIEKAPVPVTQFEAPKHGTEWQPFFEGNG